jgi:D-lactate dehydrogenase (cytochrome)
MGLSDVEAGFRNAAGIETVIGVLRQRFGDRLQTGEALRAQHAHTTTYLPAQSPDAVAFPESADEIKMIVRACAAHKVPVIPFGAGSSLEGHVNAPHGGISIDMARMNRVLEVNAEDLDCTVEPGVTREQLNSDLRDTGLFFPIDPGANASIGGMTATRASGTNAVRYGTMRDNVIAVTAVTASGEEIRTARRARKSSAGYDLTRLFVGSEGTLGVLTSVTLRLQGIPQAISGGVCPFPSVEAACNAVIMTIQMGIPVARIELLDALQMKACNAYSGLSYPESPTLFLEFHGTDAGVAEQAGLFSEIASECGGGEFQWTAEAEHRTGCGKPDTMHTGRHCSFVRAPRVSPQMSACRFRGLPNASPRPRPISSPPDLIAPIVGHAGDGNFHVLVLIDTGDPAEIAAAEDFVGRLNERALAMDGTCTGEHGIGQGKRPYLSLEMGEGVAVMRQIKQGA